MRWVLGLVPFAVAASCGGVIAGSSDAGNDGGTTATACSTDADCTNGFACEFVASEGCSASKRCFPHVACKGAFACACDGTTISTCGQGAPKPIAHLGSCNPDASVHECNGIACEVCDVSGYTPTPQAKPITASGACSAADITAFVTACLGSSANASKCQAWQQSDSGTCTSCVLTQASSATWGPFVCDSSGCSFNRGGCIDATLGQTSLENGTDTGSCGDFYRASDGCIAYACAACAPSDLTACTSDATANECKTWVDAATNTSVCHALDAGATACFPQTEADYAAFVDVFCGTGP